MGKGPVYEQLPIQLQQDIYDAVKDVELKIFELTGRDCIVKIEKNVAVLTIHTRTRCGVDVVNLIQMDMLDRKR